MVGCVFDSSSAKLVGAEFLFSVPQLPIPAEANLPEVAFFGRSNAGKSTLLNELCKQKQLARVSKTPGRTGALNYFRIKMLQGPHDQRVRWESNFVDTPGYGYARTGDSERRRWDELMSGYLAERKLLHVIVLVIDSRREVAEEEEWIRENVREREFIVVLTKADQVARSERDAKLLQVKKQLNVRSENLFFSAFVGKQRHDPNGLRLRLCELTFPFDDGVSSR